MPEAIWPACAEHMLQQMKLAAYGAAYDGALRKPMASSKRRIMAIMSRVNGVNGIYEPGEMRIIKHIENIACVLNIKAR